VFFLNSRSQETINVLLLLVVSEMRVHFACESLSAGNVINFIVDYRRPLKFVQSCSSVATSLQILDVFWSDMQGILQLIRKAEKIGSVRPQKAYKFVKTADNINSKAHKANSRKD